MISPSTRRDPWIFVYYIVSVMALGLNLWLTIGILNSSNGLPLGWDAPVYAVTMKKIQQLGIGVFASFQYPNLYGMLLGTISLLGGEAYEIYDWAHVFLDVVLALTFFLLAAFTEPNKDHVKMTSTLIVAALAYHLSRLTIEFQRNTFVLIAFLVYLAYVLRIQNQKPTDRHELSIFALSLLFFILMLATEIEASLLMIVVIFL